MAGYPGERHRVTILEGLRGHLVSDSVWRGQQLGLQIAALVGTRIYPLRLPQKPTLPAIVLQRISGVRFGAHLRGPAAIGRPRFQVDSWAQTYDAATSLGTLVRRRLEGYTGAWTDGGSPAVTARVVVMFDDEQDLFVEDIGGGLCRHSADYFIFHNTLEGVL